MPVYPQAQPGKSRQDCITGSFTTWPDTSDLPRIEPRTAITILRQAACRAPIDQGQNWGHTGGMPLAIDADWVQIQALFLQNVKVPDLAKRFGVNPATIVTRAKRGGWYRLKKTAQIINKHADNPATATVAQLAMMVTDQADQNLQLRGTAVRERLAKDCEVSLTKLEAMEATDLKTMELRERAAKMLTDRTMRVYGMEERQQPGYVNMVGLAARVIALTRDPVIEAEPVADAEPTPASC
ncbi:MAG: hypothetical protein JWR69_2224 [Pedosphaera sp.]|nr:hypothetical protein [Pedosphaera sp.]